MREQLINILPFFISGFCLFFMLVFAGTYHPEKSIARTYEKVNKRLKEKKTGLFDYKKTEAFLLANGAAYSFGKWINPINYMGIRLIVAAMFFYIGMGFHWILSLAGTVLGYFLPKILVLQSNHKDNNRMLMQIKTVYNALSVQTKSGVYITSAMSECYTRLAAGRLRDALEELSVELLVKKSFGEAVSNLNSKFNNEFIDMLCITIQQGKETGKTTDMLSDILEQISDMNAALMQKRKEALDRVATGCIIGILCAGVIFLVYVFVVEIYGYGMATFL